MMANSESRKREAERAAGELVADVDTLAGVIRRNNNWLSEGETRVVAEALVAAGFGRIDAARREIAEAERRGAALNRKFYEEGVKDGEASAREVVRLWVSAKDADCACGGCASCTLHEVWWPDLRAALIGQVRP